MGFIQRLLWKRGKAIESYADFWTWFRENEQTFFNVLSNEKANRETDFFDRILPKLDELKDGFYLLAGMYDPETAELIITADGDARNIVFAEELVAAAPSIAGWKFTALKQPDQGSNAIRMDKYEFNEQNIHFCVNELADYPDEIDISIVSDHLTDLNRDLVTSGVYIFIDNYLGELDSLTNIDNLSVIGRNEATGDLIPISKLKSYLIWRQKEFVEKYDAVRHDSEEDLYGSFEATLPNGNPLFAVMNTTLLEWDAKASHPWIVILTIKYKGINDTGMPDNDDYQRLNEIEDEIMSQLSDTDGYLNLGRQTASDEREIYFACKDFRLPSKVLYATQLKFAEAYEMSYDIYKDKYWKWFDRFTQN